MKHGAVANKQTEQSATPADYLLVMKAGTSSVAITDHAVNTENENPIFPELAIDHD